jgi:cytoskeletal protein CcmA (bactofilin family)
MVSIAAITIPAITAMAPVVIETALTAIIITPMEVELTVTLRPHHTITTREITITTRAIITGENHMLTNGISRKSSRRSNSRE